VLTGQCFNYGCTDSTASPGLRKRVDLPSQHVIQQRLCPKGFQPCPIYPKGYEVRRIRLSRDRRTDQTFPQCVDVMNDIESCGGCVGRNMPASIAPRTSTPFRVLGENASSASITLRLWLPLLTSYPSSRLRKGLLRCSGQQHLRRRVKGRPVTSWTILIDLE
jgi:hypothetical protein